MHSRAQFGQWGEEKACEYLLAEGYSIIERNYRSEYGEIDIIAGKKSIITFVEVKSRKNLAFGRPAEAVTKNKQIKIHNTAFYYLQQNRISYRSMSFDVIEIILDETKTQINHIKHCF